MKIIFYLGVILAVAGLFVYSQSFEFRNLGILLVCIGVAAVVIGFGGLIVNALIDNLHLRKKKVPANKGAETEGSEVKGSEISEPVVKESEANDSDKPQN